VSLRSFHVFFIVMAVFCLWGFCAWTFWAGTAPREAGLQAAGIGCGLAGTALAAYGLWFAFKKSRKIII
jgi:hypothetical protein